MKKYLIVILLWSVGANAQHTISGTFSPAKEFTWLVAYHLKPGTQNYIADTAITDGQFILKIPENKPTGIYRLVYAVPQEEFYFDVIYNGKEDVKLNFDASEGVTFTTSSENIPYSTYLKEINEIERSLINFYTSGNTHAKEFKEIVSRLAQRQNQAEKDSESLLAHRFVKANRPYIPSNFETLSQYVANKKSTYFSALNVSDTALQASGLLTDKLMNYVFTALPLEQIDAQTTEEYIQENVDKVAKELAPVNDTYRFSVLHTLWSQAAASRLNAVSDYIYESYLKELALGTDNTQVVLDIETHNRLRLGAEAPELEWKENDSVQKLSNWQGAERYLLVFWSSTCGHCLKELPALHKKIGTNPELKTLAIGLEDNDTYWTIESAKMPNFTHSIALGKWDNEYADLYNIKATPSYFILDKEKRIIAKPESDRQVVEFLENTN